MSQESDLQQLRGQALEAYQQGRPTFVARIKLSIWNPPANGEVRGWSDSVDAVESAGWILQHWTASVDSGGALNAFPLFRRREGGWSPQDQR